MLRKKSKYSLEEEQRILDDIKKVGPEKPLGYLPLSTLRDCRTKVGHILKWARKNGLEALVLDHHQSKIMTGAIVVYDEEALRHLLETNESTLEEAGWPIDTERFVIQVMNEIAPKRTALFNLIADAFNNQDNVNRS